MYTKVICEILDQLRSENISFLLYLLHLSYLYWNKFHNIVFIVIKIWKMCFDFKNYYLFRYNNL